MRELITLLVLTKNRSEFLRRLLRYYSDLGFQGSISIADSSNAYHVEQTKNTVKRLDGAVRIVYQEFPHFKFRRCMEKVTESVSTPYVAYLGDDDFLVPAGLEECVRFLETHRDYSAAHGVGAIFSLDSSGPYGRFRWVCRYPQRGIEAETASQRLFDYCASPFMPLFSVHRTEAWRVVYENVVPAMDWSFADELLPSCVSVIQGKIKELDCFHLAFQEHDQRTVHPDLFDIVTDPTWAPSYQIFRDCLAEELVRKDGISVEGARAFVKQAYWLCLARVLTKKWEHRYASRTGDSGSWLRKSMRRIPGLTRVWRAMRSWTRRNEDEISLPALLRPSSPYHSEFMPIYQAVTHPPMDLQESTELSGYLGRGATSS